MAHTTFHGLQRVGLGVLQTRCITSCKVKAIKLDLIRAGGVRTNLLQNDYLIRQRIIIIRMLYTNMGILQLRTTLRQKLRYLPNLILK